jgi:hypothetical protein
MAPPGGQSSNFAQRGWSRGPADTIRIVAITSEELEALKARLRAIDPDLVDAAADVEPALLAYSLSMSPLERLEAATKSAHGLARFRHDPSQAG